MASTSTVATAVTTETTLMANSKSSYTPLSDAQASPVTIQVTSGALSPWAPVGAELAKQGKAATRALADGACYVILYTLHMIYLVVILSKMLHNKMSRLRKSLSHYLYAIEGDRIDRIHQDRQHLTKIPKHLAIVVSQERLIDRSPEEWNAIVHEICVASCWAWEFGIQEMSVFDGVGVLKSMAIDIYKLQSSLLHYWMNESRSEKPRPGLKFTVLSDQDGKSQFASVAQNIARHIKASDCLTSKDINIDMVDEFVHANGVSDPDLLLLYDGLPHNYLSLDGFPPWHIRLTEFINESACHRLDYDVFSKCLYRYSRVEQRFGH